MANQRPCNSRINNSRPPRFRLDIFESRVRKALSVECNRPCGTPGSDARPLPPDSSRAAIVYLIDQLMSKFDDGRSSEQKAENAYTKFFVAEEGCYWRNFFFSQEHHWIDKNYPELERAKQIILDLMSPVVDLERVARGFGWGPGASTRLSRLTGDSCYKYSGQPEVTPNAYALGNAAISQNPLWKHEVDLVDGPRTVWGSRLTTVPKNYKIDRCIAVEPDLNMFVQKGIGSVIRQKLKSVGINLDSQEANQLGARDSSLATIDFSMASDSVSQGLVWYLMPPNWSELLQSARSELCVLPNKRLHRLSKISSMGNGFTFELETLIFWALACACVPVSERSRVLVYGDDVLLPVEYAERFIDISKVAGFLTNEEKSFISGPFRESCGVHIHNGHDISPFYVRRPVTTWEDLFLLHNNLRRWQYRCADLLTRDQYDALTKIRRELRNLAPAKWRRPRLPDGFGDGAFIGSFAECAPRVHRDGWEYFETTVWEEISSIRETELPGLLVKSLTNLHKRKRVITNIWEPTLSALPSSGRGRKQSRIVFPWSAFG